MGEDACNFSLSSFEIAKNGWMSEDCDDGCDDQPMEREEWLEEGDRMDVRTV